MGNSVYNRHLGKLLLTHTAVLKQTFSSLGEREIKGRKYISLDAEHPEKLSLQ